MAGRDRETIHACVNEIKTSLFLFSISMDSYEINRIVMKEK